MKKLIFLVLLSILCSCSKSKEETMMYEYEKQSYQKILDINIDNANFKVNSIEKVKDITAADSLRIVESYFNEKKASKVSQLKETIAEAKKDIEEINQNASTTIKAYGESGKKLIADRIKTKEETISISEKALKLYEGDCKGTFLESAYARIQDYKNKGNKAICTVYKGSFDITTPLGVKTFTKHYFTNSEGTKIIESEKL